MRTFIAIEIPSAVKKALDAQSASLQKDIGRAVRWVNAQNIHLTLKFLGEISSDKVKPLSQALQAECTRQTPFEISVGGLGCFPNPRRPRVMWAGLSVPPELSSLWQNIESAALRLGFPAEEKPYSPHLTLGRVNEQAAPGELEKIRTALDRPFPDILGTFTVNSVTLFKSDLQPAGPVYTALHRAAFASQTTHRSEKQEKEII